MPTLTLKFKDNTLGDYQLAKGRSLSIGRRQDNDVVIENLAVSGHHAKIDSVGNGFVLVDLQSKNGSFVNEQLVNSHWLNHGDVINIGKHALIFAYSDEERQSEGRTGGMDKTMVMDTSQYRNMMEKSTPNIPQPISRGTLGDGILTYLAGGQGKIKMTKGMIQIGKNPSSDIVVKGLFTGRTAATISKRPDGYYLSFVEGISKPKVNGKPVRHSVFLEDLDIIDIGSTKLQFFVKE
ncbi:MAG: FHA domain-containing protein [Desulfobacterales bacterium]|nr:MAG: FHA domain-containing protein [Desulfobacterales bacterium]